MILVPYDEGVYLLNAAASPPAFHGKITFTIGAQNLLRQRFHPIRGGRPQPSMEELADSNLLEIPIPNAKDGATHLYDVVNWRKYQSLTKTKNNAKAKTFCCVVEPMFDGR